MLFVNGIPTATLELKSEFKQSVENAKRQYLYDRPVKDPITRKPEPFHVYSMRQAIEEGFILDVLQNYATYGTEVSDEDQLHFAQGIANRVSRDEAVMEQVRNHNEGQVMHGLLPKKVIDAVLDAMGDTRRSFRKARSLDGSSFS